MGLGEVRGRSEEGGFLYPRVVISWAVGWLVGRF